MVDFSLFILPWHVFFFFFPLDLSCVTTASIYILIVVADFLSSSFFGLTFFFSLMPIYYVLSDFIQESKEAEADGGFDPQDQAQAYA